MVVPVGVLAVDAAGVFRAELGGWYEVVPLELGAVGKAVGMVILVGCMRWDVYQHECLDDLGLTRTLPYWDDPYLRFLSPGRGQPQTLFEEAHFLLPMTSD